MIRLTTEEFNALSKEAKDEFIYFTQRFHEVSHEMMGIEQGLKMSAVYLADVSECTNAISRVKVRNAWVEKELESQEAYQELSEDKDKAERRLEGIVRRVRESE